MLQKLKKRFKNERGMTLVELLAVIVILAIISAIAFVYISGVISNSKQDAHVANAQQIISAAKLHEATGGELEVTADDLQKGDFLEAKIVNPWSKKSYENLDDIKVKKDGDELTISGFSVDKCNLKDDLTETELSKEGRELCKTSGSEGSNN